jgi:hypothetical protein
LQLWCEIAKSRPVSFVNLLRQLVSAARFSLRKPDHSERITFYVSANDRLVSPMCSRDISRRWNVKLFEHPSAGHDLPLDDGPWLRHRMCNLARADFW